MGLKEETVDSVEAFAGCLVKLRVDRVRLPNGSETKREIVVHRGAVAIVPLLDDRRLLMIRQFRQAAGEVLLEIPAGTLEPGEDPAACAHRELQEEVGYTAGRMMPMFKSYLAPGYSTELLHTYIARDLQHVGVDREPDEFMEVVEIEIDRAIDMIGEGKIRDAKSIAGILMAKRVLGDG